MDPYEILGVTSSCSQEDLKASYKRLLLEHHPDKSRTLVATDRYRKIMKAWEMIGTVEARSRYDAKNIVTIAESVIIAEFEEVNDTEGLLRRPCRCGDYYEVVRQSRLILKTSQHPHFFLPPPHIDHTR